MKVKEILYNVTVSEKYNYIFFEVAKSGSRTVVKYLRKYGEVTFEKDRISLERLKKKLKKTYEEYYKFSIVRNPFSRLVSCYVNKVVKYKDPNLKRWLSTCKDKNFEFFVGFVSQHNINKCNRHIRSSDSLVPQDVNYVGKLENFDRDFKYIIEKIGIEYNKVITRNKSIYTQPWKKYYTPQIKEKVEIIYKEDIKRFGYEF